MPKKQQRLFIGFVALVHERDIRFGGQIHNNKMERMNGELRDREKELGHVLGLGDNCVASDLMFSFCNGVPGTITAYLPSTLDLYAAYLQAISGNAYYSLISHA